MCGRQQGEVTSGFVSLILRACEEIYGVVVVILHLCKSLAYASTHTMSQCTLQAAICRCNLLSVLLASKLGS